jgi:hypothetical protein
MAFRDDVPFRVSDAVRAGHSRAALDSRHFEMPFHGIRSPLGVSDLLSLCRAYSLRMRQDGAFTSLTAAALWGIPLPAHVDLTRLMVSVPHGRPRPRSRGVVGTERLHDLEVVEFSGLRVLSPPATWASLAGAMGIGDLVAAGDDLVGSRRGHPLATLDELLAIATRRGWGAPRLRTAAARVRVGSRSRPESLSRVLFVESGIPEPELNFLLPDVGVYLDLAWPSARLGYEYQGGHHVDAAQHAADVRRQERVHDIEWLLMEATKYDLFDAPLATVERVRSRLESRGVRTRRTNPPIWALPRR